MQCGHIRFKTFGSVVTMHIYRLLTMSMLLRQWHCQP